MFVFCCRNEGKRFMLTTIKKTLREHELSCLCFCIPNLFVRVPITITIVLQLGRPSSSSFFFGSLVCLSTCLLPSPLFYNQEGLSSPISLCSFVRCCCHVSNVDHSWITMPMLCPPLASCCGCCCCSSMKVHRAKAYNIQEGPNLIVVGNT
jgi:hypothetical protein